MINKGRVVKGHRVHAVGEVKIDNRICFKVMES